MAKFVSWEQAVTWLLAQPNQQQLVRDCYFDAEPDVAAQRYAASAEWQAVREFLPVQVGQVLDLGAGRGIASFALAKQGWQVVALEPDPSELVGGGAIRTIAQTEHLPITVLQEFGERIPCDSASFELVFARQVLHHARDLEALCAEVFRLLKPGGRLVAIRDHVISSPDDLAAFWQIHPLHNLYGGENAFQLHQYLAAFRSAGFVVERVLRPFDSVINFAPYSRSSLRVELQQRLARFPLGGVAGALLNSGPILTAALALLSRFDQRPGRLYSFICSKPQR